METFDGQFVDIGIITVKALLYYGQRDIRLEEIAVPKCGPDEVRIKVTHSGISQTHINEFIEGPFIINADPHPVTGHKIPLIPGHEFGGTIEAVGDPSNEHLIGQQVAVLPRISCGECYTCQQGKENICEQLVYIGLAGAHGGFAEYAVVDKRNTFPVEDTALMSFVEPILVGIHVGRMLGTDLHKCSTLLLGAGGVGISVATVLKYYYGMDITIADFLPNRLSIAAAEFETIHKDDIEEKYDIVIDCAGSDPASQETALLESFKYVHTGGTILSVGVYFHPVTFVPATLTLAEIQLRSSFAYSPQDEQLLPEVLAAIPIKFEQFIEEVSLEDLVEEGYYRSEVDKDSLIRIVARP